MAAGAAAAFCSTLVSMRLIAMLERSRSLLPYAAYRSSARGPRRCSRFASAPAHCRPSPPP